MATILPWDIELNFTTQPDGTIKITVTPMGGCAPYSYKICKDNRIVSVSNSYCTDGQVANNISAVVTDACGQSARGSISISQNLLVPQFITALDYPPWTVGSLKSDSKDLVDGKAEVTFIPQQVAVVEPVEAQSVVQIESTNELQDSSRVKLSGLYNDGSGEINAFTYSANEETIATTELPFLTPVNREEPVALTFQTENYDTVATAQYAARYAYYVERTNE